jgi:hypothetical protein
MQKKWYAYTSVFQVAHKVLLIFYKNAQTTGSSFDLLLNTNDVTSLPSALLFKKSESTELTYPIFISFF